MNKQSRINAELKKHDQKVVDLAKTHGLINDLMNASQIKEILTGIETIDYKKVKVYADENLSHKHMAVARLLLENGYSPAKMILAIENIDIEGLSHRHLFFYCMAKMISKDSTDLINRFMAVDEYSVTHLYEKYLTMVKKYRLSDYVRLNFDMDYYCAKIKWLLDNPGCSI